MQVRDIERYMSVPRSKMTRLKRAGTPSPDKGHRLRSYALVTSDAATTMHVEQAKVNAQHSSKNN
jgi:hypothetical protein